MRTNGLVTISAIKPTSELSALDNLFERSTKIKRSNASESVCALSASSSNKNTNVSRHLRSLAHFYAYDANGNLATVTYPGIPTPTQYQYDATHLLTQETDRRGNLAGVSTYYADGKLKSVTDAVGNLTQYAYDMATNKTTVTNPDSGTVVTVADAYGMPLSVTDPLACFSHRSSAKSPGKAN
jgi:YD repeat-containing protein